MLNLQREDSENEKVVDRVPTAVAGGMPKKMKQDHASTVVLATEPVLMTVKQAAQMLGISRSHFYSLDRAGRIGPMSIDLGGRRLWRRHELECWVQAGCPRRDIWMRKEAKQ